MVSEIPEHTEMERASGFHWDRLPECAVIFSTNHPLNTNIYSFVMQVQVPSNPKLVLQLIMHHYNEKRGESHEKYLCRSIQSMRMVTL